MTIGPGQEVNAVVGHSLVVQAADGKKTEDHGRELPSLLTLRGR